MGLMLKPVWLLSLKMAFIMLRKLIFLDWRKKSNMRITGKNYLLFVGTILILLVNLRAFAVQLIDDLSTDKNSLEALLPKNNELAGWERTSVPQFFVSENLWEYMNGQAESYLQCGFRILATIDYILEDNPNSLNVEIFKMQSPKHAFGIYAAERSIEDKFVKIGVEGYIGQNILNFWKGSYYVKLTTFESSKDIEDILFKFATVIAKKIEGDYSSPELFAFFPEENKIRMSERYIPQNFMGYSFLKNGYRVDYERDGNRYQVFLIENDSLEEAKYSFKKYKETIESQNEHFTYEMKSNYQLLNVQNEQGKVIFQFKSIIGGVLNINDLCDSEKIIQAIIEKLKNMDYPSKQR